jgi:hypothetical protein
MDAARTDLLDFVLVHEAETRHHDRRNGRDDIENGVQRHRHHDEDPEPARTTRLSALQAGTGCSLGVAGAQRAPEGLDNASLGRREKLREVSLERRKRDVLLHPCQSAKRTTRHPMSAIHRLRSAAASATQFNNRRAGLLCQVC